MLKELASVLDHAMKAVCVAAVLYIAFQLESLSSSMHTLAEAQSRVEAPAK